MIRIPPEKLGRAIEDVMEVLGQENFEGKLDKQKNLIILTNNFNKKGRGKIIHGDGGVYQRITFSALTFSVEVQEVVEGLVCEILEFGAFVRLGPLEALLHISQIMDDRIDVNVANGRLIGRETNRDLGVGDLIRARVVTAAMNDFKPRESKIGLTMKQTGLGKFQWLDEQRAKDFGGVV